MIDGCINHVCFMYEFYISNVATALGFLYYFFTLKIYVSFISCVFIFSNIHLNLPNYIKIKRL